MFTGDVRSVNNLGKGWYLGSNENNEMARRTTSLLKQRLDIT
jgi:hypothetical protein